jgi:tetratricopeptide (TPR) repeat protein
LNLKALAMPLDPYQPCPCGTEKKVKFCCGNDLIHDYNKIEELITGEQRLAALDQINRSLAQKPDRGCLYLLKAQVQIELRELEQAQESINELLKLMPSNPAGLGMLAILEGAKGDALEAVDTLQSALEASQGKLQPQVYNAIGFVGRSLAAQGILLGARGHLLFQTSITGGKDQRAVQALIELDGSGHVPLPALGLEVLGSADANGRLSAAGIAELTTALKSAGMGCWLSAVDKLDVLAEREPYEPAVWKNIGTLRAWLGQEDKARAAFRRYASFASVPRDDAVEAEAVVQFLSDLTEEDLVAEITTSFAVTDPQALQEQLLSNKRVEPVPFDPAEFREANEVPPLSAFLLLDREVPEYREGMKAEEIPVVLGELQLFGKQTDRAARIELSTLKTADFDAKVQSLQQVLGSFAVASEGEEVSGKITRLGAALASNWRLPDAMPVPERKNLLEAHRAHVLQNVFPDLPQGVLDGKSLRQAAADASLQARALAVILLMDLAEPEERPEFNQIRKSLGLPTVESLDPAGLRINSLSPVRLTRLDVKKLSDDDLLIAYQRGILYSAGRLLRKVGPELVSRPTIKGKVDFADVYELLARLSGSSDQAIEFIHKAQEAAVAGGESPARHLMAEIPLRLERREVDEFRRLFERLSTKHIKEPGVAQSLQMLLYQLGILRPDGSMAQPGAMPPPGASAAAPAPASGLWTPDQGAPAAAAAPAGGGKSKLWVPGMD